MALLALLLNIIAFWGMGSVLVALTSKCCFSVMLGWLVLEEITYSRLESLVCFMSQQFIRDTECLALPNRQSPPILSPDRPPGEYHQDAAPPYQRNGNDERTV
jgi:hypothetical protein